MEATGRQQRCARSPAVGRSSSTSVSSQQPSYSSSSMLRPSQQLRVCTRDGEQLRVPFEPGTTTAADIRRIVAEQTGLPVDQVRLAYAGHELPPSCDSQLFVVKNGNLLLHTVPLRGSTVPRPVTQQVVAAMAVGRGNSSAENGKTPRIVGQAVTAPGAGRKQASAEVQLAKQFRDLNRHPIAGISAAPDDTDTLRWHIRLAGPPGSPYQGGWFDLELQFTHRFPGEQPAARFITPIFHPNVDPSSGRVCVAMGGSRGVCSVACVLTGLQMLLSTPNPDSPLNHECAEMMRSNKLQYVAKAESMTTQHAMGKGG